MSLESVFCFDGAKDDDFVRTPLTGGRGRPLESREDDALTTFSFVVVVVDGEERLGGGAGGEGVGGVEAEADLNLVVGEGGVGRALVEKDLARGEDGACA